MNSSMGIQTDCVNCDWKVDNGATYATVRFVPEEYYDYQVWTSHSHMIIGWGRVVRYVADPTGYVRQHMSNLERQELRQAIRDIEEKRA